MSWVFAGLTVLVFSLTVFSMGAFALCFYRVGFRRGFELGAQKALRMTARPQAQGKEDEK